MREYPTDEELERLIAELEQQELYAPKHMKEQILSQVFPKQTDKMPAKSGSAQKPIALFTYRLKIVAGMAAALIMLAVIPMQNGSLIPLNAVGELQTKQQEQKDEEEGINLNALLNESMRKVNRKMNAWLEKGNNRQMVNLPEENEGGYQDEN
ncbi:MAG: hypothetical protein SPK58_10060 [Lachnospiraceae bacterium]|nr:hypothetical protein [Lachnospiraceae bacterium]